MQTIVDAIVAAEWAMFQEVHNAGGRASCQDDYRTFSINRRSQFLSWSEEAVKSYLADCGAAREKGRNLLTEKYARMMRWTAPEEYAAIESVLPPVSEEAAALTEMIAAVQVPWQQAFADAYPNLGGKGRPVRTSDETPGGAASFETYLRGELLTYSERTLRLYAARLKALQEKGENISLISMRRMVELNGFASLEEAEQKAGKSQQ